MTLVDFMICDYAQVADGRLFISGGGVGGSHFPAVLPDGQPYVVAFAVAGTVTFPYDADGEHVINVTVVDADGRAPLATAAPERAELTASMAITLQRTGAPVPGEEPLVPFAFNFAGVPFAAPGRFAVLLSVNGAPAEPKVFQVTVPAPPASPRTFGSGPTDFRL